MHEELNREEDTNVTVKRHVCTRDVRPREKTRGKGRARYRDRGRARESVGKERKGSEREEERSRMGRPAFYSLV